MASVHPPRGAARGKLRSLQASKAQIGPMLELVLAERLLARRRHLAVWPAAARHSWTEEICLQAVGAAVAAAAAILRASHSQTLLLPLCTRDADAAPCRLQHAESSLGSQRGPRLDLLRRPCPRSCNCAHDGSLPHSRELLPYLVQSCVRDTSSGSQTYKAVVLAQKLSRTSRLRSSSVIVKVA